ncbi:hypothetical protein GCM10022245_28440 [Streptomyces mayteni]
MHYLHAVCQPRRASWVADVTRFPALGRHTAGSVETSIAVSSSPSSLVIGGSAAQGVTIGASEIPVTGMKGNLCLAACRATRSGGPCRSARRVARLVMLPAPAGHKGASPGPWVGVKTFSAHAGPRGRRHTARPFVVSRGGRQELVGTIR